MATGLQTISSNICILIIISLRFCSCGSSWQYPNIGVSNGFVLYTLKRLTKIIPLTHWGRVTHICVGNLAIIGSDNGLSPGRRQAITWTNVGILLIGPLGTNFSEMLIEIKHFHSRKSIWKCRLKNGGHFVSASMCWTPSDEHHVNTWTHWGYFDSLGAEICSNAIYC